MANTFIYLFYFGVLKSDFKKTYSKSYILNKLINKSVLQDSNVVLPIAPDVIWNTLEVKK